jgi:hypothetical protein
MKMITVIILFLALFLNAKAPDTKAVYLIEPEEINYYAPLIRAITTIESNNGKYQFNAKENAVGWFQIRQCRVDHYNRLKRTNFVLTDFYDYDLSRDMFLYFAEGKDYETAARNWNGSGKMTIEYWKKVRAKL